MPDAVVDIGNSRIKFCRVANGVLQLPVHGMAADDFAGWERLATEWGFTPGQTWAIASTVPDLRKRFTDWAASRGERALPIDSVRKIPIGVDVDVPDGVGIDRLLNAAAVKALVKAGEPAIIVNAGCRDGGLP